MTTISLAMIVRDGELTLARALECAVGLCDELIVVDTGSRDRSKAIAIEKGATVYDFVWIDDFSAARNYSFEQCTGDWILWLDADDAISQRSRRKLIELKDTELSENFDAIYLPYQASFCTNDLCELTLYRERLLRRRAAPKWNYPVHECIQVPAERSLFLDDIFIEHRPSAQHRAHRERARNLKIIENFFDSGERNQRMLFYYGNELYDHDRFEQAICAYRDFLERENPKWERYWAIRRVCSSYFFMEQFDSALEWGLLAIENDPERAEAFNDVGMIHYRHERLSQAIPYFLAATKLQKPRISFVEDSHYSWLPYDYLSSSFLGLGDYEKALENALKASHAHPDSKRSQENIEFLTRLTKCR